MRRLVIDASVAVKWVLTEVHGEAARRIMAEADEMHAPELLWAEIGSVLWKRRRRGEFGAAEAREMLDDLRSLPIAAHTLAPLVPRALDIAVTAGHSLYDCLYLALAEREDCPLVTADRRFRAAFAADPLGERLVWIEAA